MKSTIIASVALLLTAVFAVISPSMVSSLLDGIEEQVATISEADSAGESSSQKLIKTIEDKRIALSLFLPDGSLQELRGFARDMHSAAKMGDKGELNIAKSRLIGLINQQRRLSSFDIEAIL